MGNPSVALGRCRCAGTVYSLVLLLLGVSCNDGAEANRRGQGGAADEAVAVSTPTLALTPPSEGLLLQVRTKTLPAEKRSRVLRADLVGCERLDSGRLLAVVGPLGDWVESMQVGLMLETSEKGWTLLGIDALRRSDVLLPDNWLVPTGRITVWSPVKNDGELWIRFALQFDADLRLPPFRALVRLDPSIRSGVLIDWKSEAARRLQNEDHR